MPFINKHQSWGHFFIAEDTQHTSSIMKLSITIFSKNSSSVKSSNLSRLSETAGSFLHRHIPCHSYKYLLSLLNYLLRAIHLPTESDGICNVMSQHCNQRRGKKLYCKNMTTAVKENRLLLFCKYHIHCSGNHADKERIKCHRHSLADYVCLTI